MSPVSFSWLNGPIAAERCQRLGANGGWDQAEVHAATHRLLGDQLRCEPVGELVGRTQRRQRRADTGQVGPNGSR